MQLNSISNLEDIVGLQIGIGEGLSQTTIIDELIKNCRKQSDDWKQFTMNKQLHKAGVMWIRNFPLISIWLSPFSIGDEDKNEMITPFHRIYQSDDNKLKENCTLTPRRKFPHVERQLISFPASFTKGVFYSATKDFIVGFFCVTFAWFYSFLYLISQTFYYVFLSKYWIKKFVLCLMTISFTLV